MLLVSVANGGGWWGGAAGGVSVPGVPGILSSSDMRESPFVKGFATAVPNDHAAALWGKTAGCAVTCTCPVPARHGLVCEDDACTSIIRPGDFPRSRRAGGGPEAVLMCSDAAGRPCESPFPRTADRLMPCRMPDRLMPSSGAQGA